MRKNVLRLSTGEWTTVVNALGRLKSSGAYDSFTRRHMDAMMDLTLYRNETGTMRNVAHKGPALLVWHRKFLLEFEAALGVPVPYWNWEPLGPRWQSSSVWNLVGHNGSPSASWRIQDGPFAKWTSIISTSSGYAQRTGIVRNFQTGSLGTVGTTPITYDAWPWREDTDPARSFRRTFEAVHNTVHNLVGGDMSTGTSPNDPLFWLHHCNVDRIFSRWLAANGPTYLPTTTGPPGHNLHDSMRHLSSTTTPADMLDTAALGITYDTLE